MAEISSVNPSSPEPTSVARAAELLRRGEVIAIPTDTFYGIAANPFDPAAVEKVFAIKGRPKDNPLLLLIDSIAMAEELAADLPPEFYVLAKRFWPGPLTMVVQASSKLPEEVTANTGTIGLRLPRAPVAMALIREMGCPITATSANRTGEPDCSNAQQVESTLGNRLRLIIDGGGSHADKPSTVIGLIGKSWEILREGSIPRSEVAACLEAWNGGN